MKNDRTQAFWHQRIGKMLIAGMMAIVAAILAPTSAKAGVLDSLSQFNNKLFTKLATISGNLAKDITSYTGISTTEIQTFLGARNLIDPTAMSKSIVNSQAASGNPVTGTPKTEVSRAVNSMLASQILSKENQQSFVDEQKINQETSNEIKAAATKSATIANKLQSSQSSQEILKGVSTQMSDVMKAQAAMVEMNTKQATSDQVTQSQLAALNQNAADATEDRLGTKQGELLDKLRKSKGQSQSYIDNMNSR
jgi:hypothetical protein